MSQFWWATFIFVILGLTPIVVATLAHLRQRDDLRASRSDEGVR